MLSSGANMVSITRNGQHEVVMKTENTCDGKKRVVIRRRFQSIRAILKYKTVGKAELLIKSAGEAGERELILRF